MIICGIIIVILFIIWKYLDPEFEVAPISYDSGKWLIVWYYSPGIENKKLIKFRSWAPLIRINND